jgi:hypothetical protein
MLRARQLFNNIRRYNHSHSPSHKQIEEKIESSINVKMDKIMLKLHEIEINVKCIYYVSVITGLLLIFK